MLIAFLPVDRSSCAVTLELGAAGGGMAKVKREGASSPRRVRGESGGSLRLSAGLAAGEGEPGATGRSGSEGCSELDGFTSTELLSWTRGVAGSEIVTFVLLSAGFSTLSGMVTADCTGVPGRASSGFASVRLMRLITSGRLMLRMVIRKMWYTGSRHYLLIDCLGS